MDKENFKDLVSMAIFALAEEKVGGPEYAREYWERIRNASDVFISVMETNEPDGIFCSYAKEAEFTTRNEGQRND